MQTTAFDAEETPVRVEIGDASLTTVFHRVEHGVPTDLNIYNDITSTVTASVKRT